MSQRGHYPLASTDPAQAIPASPAFPAIEERVLKYWDADNTFQASIDQRPARDADGQENEFVFYDGPPFANGLPHYGHLITGYCKDLVARYQTQAGHRTERRFGWDTHGLPAELEAMKQLGMTDKAQIEEMGIEHFNAACKKSVMKYADQWQDYVTRQARWVDFENDYKTLNVSFMESVLWAFKTLHTRGLTYQGFRVLPYCWKDETPLSNHELRMDDDVYQDRQDTTVTVAFPITSSDHPLAEQLHGVRALAWTTTPWTLPTNLALAVHPEEDYVVLPLGPAGSATGLVGPVLLARELVGSYAADLGYQAGKTEDGKKITAADAALAAVTHSYRGAELAGLRYEPLWDYFCDTERFGTENAWQILADDYVTTADGTGIVHQAPAYGEDDQRVCEAHGIPVLLSVDDGAKFLPNIFDHGPLEMVAGRQVFEANMDIVRQLRSGDRLVNESSYVHSYPHCWRCRTPLIYRAITSWYVKVTAIKDRMLELNEQINWIPGNVKHGQFGKWVENARDWSISRNRYWGSPIPVWVSDDPNYPREEVYGSLAELEEAFGTLPRNEDGEVDLHRPYIDQLTRPNPDDPTGKSMMRRVEDVLDVWFDSGSMPFAQVHYPFENTEWFDTHNPADFIVEYIGQTRGWFYTMHILATALFDRPAFTNVISHGIILGNDGRKMSKSLRNYPDVNEVFDRDGADAMRWFLISSPVLRGGTLIVTEEGIREGVRQVLLPLWNVWHFFSLYANAAKSSPGGYQAKLRYDSPNALDQYLLAATGEFIRQAQQGYENYALSEVTAASREYIQMLTNWYVRRSRQRFFAEDPLAFDTLYTALEAFCRVAAPLLPLVTEEIWRGLTGGRSVHLTDYPDADLFDRDAQKIALMDLTRDICSHGLALRKSADLRVRLPLSRLLVAVPEAAELSGYYQQIIAEELNVKEVQLLDSSQTSPEDYGIRQQLVVNARAAGPRLGKNVQQVIKAAKAGDWQLDDDGQVSAGGIELVEGEYTLSVEVDAAAADQCVSVLPGEGFLVLDTEVTPELAAEGFARDLVRAIAVQRKEAGLAVDDRIITTLKASEEDITKITAHQQMIAQETLSEEIRTEVDAAAETPQIQVTRCTPEGGTQ